MLLADFINKAIRYFIPVVLFLSCLASLQAQNVKETEKPQAAEWDTSSPYYQIMVENVSKLDSSISNTGLEQLAAAFERIARVEQNKALPQYYLAFVYSSRAFREKDLDKIDEWCDRSETALFKAEQIGDVNKDEILVIRALIQYARIQVDFMSRGMEASANAERYLLEAHKHNPDNPRALSMLGQHYLRIPAQVGGSLKKFCSYAALAIEAYKQEKASFPEGIHPIVPYWGERDLLSSANKYCPSIANTTKSQ